MIRVRRSGMVLAILAGASVGCGSPADATGDVSSSVLEAPIELMIGYGDEVAVNGTVVRLAFGQVLSDSRCPVDVQCVWAGNAEVELGIRAGMGPTMPFRLNTNLIPRSADKLGLRITLLELKPVPRAGTAIKPEDYSVRVKVEAL
jgi:hypothetical protein